MLFVDTGPLLARFVARDQYHRQAIRAWAELGESRRSLATSPFVLSELLTLLGRRTSHEFAARQGRLLFGGEMVLLRSDEAVERAAMDKFQRFADQGMSFTDCLSFALMRRARISTAFTFDRHFETAGLERWPPTPP